MPRKKLNSPLVSTSRNIGKMFLKHFPDPETKYYGESQLPRRNPNGMITVTVWLDDASYAAYDPACREVGCVVRGPAKLVYSVWPDGGVDLLIYDLETNHLREEI